MQTTGELPDRCRSFVNKAKLTRSKKIMSALLKAKAEVLEGARMSLKDRAVLSEISKSKAKGETPEMMAVRASKTAGSSTTTDTLGVIAEVSYP
jgi:DNA helicase-2/ATP-dependent DNA helicase PcrA